MSQFYVAYQEAHETVLQFIIRFQNLWRKLARPLREEDVKDTFLSALRELLQMTLAMFNFKEQSSEQVIDKVLMRDKTQTSNSMSMTLL